MFPPGLSVVSLVVSGLAVAGLLVLGHIELPAGSARLAALGWIVAMTVTVAGLSVGRGRWARRHGWLLLACSIPLLVVAQPRDVWWLASGIAVSAAAVALALPSVTSWLESVDRRAPLPKPALVLMLALVDVPLVVGLVHTDGMGAGPVVGAASAMAAGWAYSRAWVTALWIIRLGTPGFVVAWGWGAPWWGWAIVATLGTVVLLAAWRGEALLAAQPLEPRRVKTQPIFAELAPEEVRRIAGIDERGNKQ